MQKWAETQKNSQTKGDRKMDQNIFIYVVRQVEDEAGLHTEMFEVGPPEGDYQTRLQNAMEAMNEFMNLDQVLEVIVSLQGDAIENGLKESKILKREQKSKLKSFFN